jgi:hypothetical protein
MSGLELVGLFVGIPGLVQTCIHGYRILLDSKNIAKDASSLHAHLRLQEGRLILFAQNWGLEISHADGDVSVAVRQASQGLVGKMELELAQALSKVVKEAVDRIAVVLTDSSKLISRYGLAPEDDQHVSKMSAVLKSWHRTKLGSPLKRLRWTVVDKAAFSQLVKDLTSFNDDLEKFIPSKQRADLGLGLQIQFAHVDSLDELDQLRAASEKYQDLQQILDLRTFRIKLEDRKVSPANALQKDMSQVTLPDLDSPTENQQRCLAMFRKEVVFGFQNVEVVIEWKAYDDLQDPKRKEAIIERVSALASLLNRVGNTKNLNTLKCLGYFTNEKFSRFGYILALPDETKSSIANSSTTAGTCGPPKSPSTLYSFIGQDRPSSSVPDLGSRMALALNLARTLLQLHAAGWLHKGLRSDNILFFDSAPKNSSDAPDISNPYLTGFEYSRPDTEMAITEALTTYSKSQDCYRHPDTLSTVGAANPITSRFRREFDVYSLGCVLLEIGLWRKLEAFWKEKYNNDPNMFRDRLLQIWSKDLGRTCGKTYESIVRLCLGEGAQGCSTEVSKSQMHDLDAFYYNIICRLQSYSV